MARKFLTLAAGLVAALTSLTAPAAHAAPAPTAAHTAPRAAVAGAWHPTTPFAGGRTSAGSARIADRLYVVGGY